jgi:hypothetical protein
VFGHLLLLLLPVPTKSTVSGPRESNVSNHAAIRHVQCIVDKPARNPLNFRVRSLLPLLNRGSLRLLKTLITTSLWMIDQPPGHVDLNAYAMPRGRQGPSSTRYPLAMSVQKSGHYSLDHRSSRGQASVGNWAVTNDSVLRYRAAQTRICTTIVSHKTPSDFPMQQCRRG